MQKSRGPAGWFSIPLMWMRPTKCATECFDKFEFPTLITKQISGLSTFLGIINAHTSRNLHVVMGKKSGNIFIIVQSITFTSVGFLNADFQNSLKSSLLMNVIITVNDRKLQVDCEVKRNQIMHGQFCSENNQNNFENCDARNLRWKTTVRPSNIIIKLIMISCFCFPEERGTPSLLEWGC